jgi:SPP1 family predicted phage head-tail adaptor
MRELAFNDFVTIQAATVTTDAIGAEVLTWGTHRAIWCRVGDVSVKEYLAADATQGRRSVKIRCYWDDVADVTPEMQVIHGSRTLQIEGVIRSDFGDRAHLMCWEATT